jgi:hypothetical protein
MWKIPQNSTRNMGRERDGKKTGLAEFMEQDGMGIKGAGKMVRKKKHIFCFTNP